MDDERRTEIGLRDVEDLDHARLAMRAPSAIASSFAHMIDGCTRRLISSCAKPQSVPAIRFSRPTHEASDSGTLYVTNKRLLFDGAQKSTSIALKKIIRFTVYSDGLKIEKDTGKDQYFIGSGDPEILGAVLERVIAQSR